MRGRPSRPIAAMDALLASASTSHPSDPHAASILHVLALDTLTPSLRLAFHHVLTVGAQRHPRWLLRAHRFRDEAYLALAAMIEAHSLRRHSASFGEHFYGVQRSATSSRAPSFTAEWLLLLLPSYLRSKAEAFIEDADVADAADAAAVVAEEAAAANDDIAVDGEPEALARPTSARPTSASALSPRLRAVLRLACRLGCALVDGANLWQLLLYMHGQSRHATLAQRLLGFALRRRQGIASPLPPPPPTATNTAVASTPSAPPASSTQPAVMRLLMRLGALLEAPFNHARQLLLLSVFSYRLLEWWHSPQHAPPPPPRLLPPPPPPPPRLPTAPATAGVCGACRMVPREPTAAPSGYVYCASCALGAARRFQRCPVSGQPMKVEDLRRLYETSRPPNTGGGAGGTAVGTAAAAGGRG